MDTEDIIKLVSGIALILIGFAITFVGSLTEATSTISCVLCLIGISLILFSFDWFEKLLI